MSDKKPIITREASRVIIECHEEKAAMTCEREISKVLKNRMLAFMMKRQMRR